MIHLNKGDIFGKLTYSGEVRRDAKGVRVYKFVCVCSRECWRHKEYIHKVKTPKCDLCGKRVTPAYKRAQNSYYAMLRRCTDPQAKSWKIYGKLGISICSSWLGVSGFKNFLADMGLPPEKYTLDRIDVNGDYSPDNCRWANRATQSRNMRHTIFVQVRDSRIRLLDFFEKNNKLGLSYATVRCRIVYLGWDPEKAIETPQRPSRHDKTRSRGTT